MALSLPRYAQAGLRHALAAAALFTALCTCAHALDAADVAPLGGDDFDAKSAAIDKLIATHDAASLALRKALADDNVTATDAGEVLVQDGDNARDAATGQPVAANIASSAQPITLNNLLRSKVAGAVSGLQLASPDLETRRAAIAGLLKNPDPAMKPMIDAARAKETDPALKRRLDTLWAMTALHDPNAATRLEAAKLVAARHDLDMYELLRPLVAKNASGAYNEPDADVRAAVQQGIDTLDAIQRRSEIAGTLFAG
ncbi:urea ABC transporter permease subunit UrtB, partial [Paraburkholderia sp. BR14261]